MIPDYVPKGAQLVIEHSSTMMNNGFSCALRISLINSSIYYLYRNIHP